MERRELRFRFLLAALSLAAALLAFHGFGPAILLVPGALYRSQRWLPARYKLPLCTVWGVVFAGSFYAWAWQYGILPWLGLVAVRGLPWLFFGLPSLVLESRSRRPYVVREALACGAGYALVTFLLLLGPTGADWETPAAALTSWPVSLALLPFIGLTGTAFLLGACSSLLWRRRPKIVALGVALLASWIGLSGYLFAQREADRLELPVALLQPGWEQDVKWDEENVEAAKKRLFDLTEEAAATGAKLVVWPETAWPVRSLRRRPSDTRAIGKLARRLEVQLLVSSIEEVEDGWYNSVSQVLPSGKWQAEYRKRRLAPFAEYIPLPRHHDERLRRYGPFSRISRYLPGEESVIFASHGRSYAALVCYESMTPQPAARLARTVDFLVVVTNDAPFRWGAAREQHFRSAILRAAQFGVPVLQAANTGVTGFIDSKGVVRARTEPGFTGPAVVYFDPTGW